MLKTVIIRFVRWDGCFGGSIKSYKKKMVGSEQLIANLRDLLKTRGLDSTQGLWVEWAENLIPILIIRKVEMFLKN